MKMPRRDWEQLAHIEADEIVVIDLSETPIAGVLSRSRVEAAEAVRTDPEEVVITVYRYDSEDEPTPINVDRYRVWERLPPHRHYISMVNRASTEDNTNMQGFLDDHVFLVKEPVAINHRLRTLPDRVKDAVRNRGAV